MVSGLVTSPCDQARITSGDASRIRIELKTTLRRCSRSSGRPNPSAADVRDIGDCSSVSCIVSYLLAGGWLWAARLDFLELHFQAKALELLHEHVERLRHARLGRVL